MNARFRNRQQAGIPRAARSVAVALIVDGAQYGPVINEETMLATGAKHSYNEAQAQHELREF